MTNAYIDEISRLIDASPFEIDLDAQINRRVPTLANSMFLIHKEQGDWAEEVVFNAINEYSDEYCAIRYGRAESLSAGDPGFAEFYDSYIEELNTIGKKPDLLIYRRSDIHENYDLDNIEFIQKAIAGIEVRSSSFLSNKYASFIDARTKDAEIAIAEIQSKILTKPYSSLLSEKRPELYEVIRNANCKTFHEIDFRMSHWSSTQSLQELSNLLRSMKEQIKILHKRDYLSITPKVEDLLLVNRWIQYFGVRHSYLQVFFDKAYIIPFKSILEIVCDSQKEDVVFSIERDVKNQGKTTIKINILAGKEILGKIDMPEHRSALKELERGRLLFYVTFHRGRGYLDPSIFLNEVVNEI